MKHLASLLGLAVLATPLLAQTPSEEVAAAAKKVADQGGFQWVAKTDFGSGGGGGGGGRGFRAGPTEGWRDKDGFTLLKVTRGDSTSEIVIKGEKGAFKEDGTWQAIDTSLGAGGGGGGGGGQPNPGRAAARTLRTFQPPTIEATELAAKTKEIKKDGDVIVGTLTEDAVKSLMTFGGRGGGGGGPEISGAQGTIKFWIKDGALGKYEYQVKGTMSFNGNDRDIERTTTVELKEGGPAPDAIPEAARKVVS